MFTFGDPILDLITDEQGWLVIGGEKHNLKAAELREPRQRYGGIHKIDLQPYLEDIKRAQVIEAVLGGGRFTLVGCSDRELIVASRNPSEQWFHKNGASMRFRAWKKSYGVYWSIGAEIETWGADFESASIESQYGELIDRGGPPVCGIVKRDSDSDSDDDYVDEYEWGIGSSSSPDGVVSLCTAQWQGQSYSETVQIGDCEVWM